MHSYKTLFVSFVSILFIFVSVSTAFAGDDVTKKMLELPEFHSISLNSNYTVNLKQSNKQEVEVNALTEIFKLSKFEVKDGVLHITVEKPKQTGDKSIWAKIDNIKLRPQMELNLSMKRINSLQVNGGGKIVSQNSINSSNLKIEANGSGGLDLDIKGTNLQTSMAGSGKVLLKGYADNNKITLSGSGSLEAFDLELIKCTARINGSGSMELNVSDELNAEIFGSGVIKHKGNTKKAEQKVYGSGSVGRSY